MAGLLHTLKLGNRPLEPRALEVEFFPMEEVLHEKVKIHRQPDHGRGQAR